VSDPVRVPLAGGLTAVVQPGPGSKVLWIHGYTLDATSWSDMWRRLPGWHHIGLELPGHGGSAPIAPGDDLRKLGRTVAELCRAQEIRHLVALSFGTLTAIQAALEDPGWLRSLTLGAPSIAGGPADPEVGVTYTRLQQQYREIGPGEVMKETWMACIAWKGVEKHPELRARLGRLVERHRWTELGDWAILRLLQPSQRVEDLSAIETPVLILIGELDLPAIHACTEVLVRELPRVERVTLPGIGHLCMLEAPDLSAGPIERHLRANDHAPSRALAEAAEA
jgi:pimeloyl-ACP methyl ester carboxylesterase